MTTSAIFSLGQRTRARVRPVSRALTVGPAMTLAVLIVSACAGGSGTSGPVVAPPIRGFDGGTQIQGGFTGVVSSIQDSVIAQPRAMVWGALPRVFEELGVETPTVNRIAFTMGNPSTRIARIAGSTRLSQYFDCGAGILGPNADRYEVTLQLLVQLVSQGSTGTLVRTTIDAYARPRTGAGDPIHCASQRTLERLIVSMISEALGASLAQAGGSEGAAAGLPPMSAGMIPSSGDHLRLQCRSPVLEGVVVGEGRYLGSGYGSVQLLLDSRGNTASVPASHVVNVEIRERRSYAGVGRLVGALVGAGVGAWWGSRYEEENPERPKYHFGKEVFIGAGGVVGALGGLLVGSGVGSLIKSDTWHQAPPEWAIRSAGAVPAPNQQTPCPSF